MTRDMQRQKRLAHEFSDRVPCALDRQCGSRNFGDVSARQCEWASMHGASESGSPFNPSGVAGFRVKQSFFVLEPSSLAPCAQLSVSYLAWLIAERGRNLVKIKRVARSKHYCLKH
uniref:Uncharacterized protein n=1 Tax=Anopheles minimus TaxID=112268 RepID=A0A182WMC4_9DIPT